MVNQTKYPQTHERVLSLDEVSQLLGRSKKTIWRWWAKEKCFPKPIQINGRSIGFKQSTIDAILTEKCQEVM